MSSPTEPVAPAGQQAPSVPPAEPPWSRGAIAAAICITTPLITVGSLLIAQRRGVRFVGGDDDALFGVLMLLIFGLPLIAGIVGGRVAKRLRALDAAVRPRGLWLAQVSNTGGYALCLGLLAYGCFGVSVPVPAAWAPPATGSP